MKKILNYSNLIILFIVINIVVLVVTCIVISSSKNNNGKLPEYTYIPTVADEDALMSDKKRFFVEEKDINLYRSYTASIGSQNIDDCYEYYTVESVNENIKIGNTIEAGSLLGTNSGAEVLANKSGKILMIENSSPSKITLYNSSNFVVSAYISQYDYYTYDFEALCDKTFFLLSDETQLKLSFIGVDYDYAIQNGCVKIDYSIADDRVILPGATGALHVIYEELEKAKCIQYDDYFYTYNQYDIVNLLKRVSKEDNTYEYEFIEILIKAYCGDYIIIEQNNINAGEYIYAVK